MKLAIVGSRNLSIFNLEDYLPPEVSEIVSGGAKGVDQNAEAIAKFMGLKLTTFLPEYEKYRRNAPLKRNQKIIRYADFVLIFWDGSSRGTKYVIEQCKILGKSHHVILL